MGDERDAGSAAAPADYRNERGRAATGSRRRSASCGTRLARVVLRVAVVVLPLALAGCSRSEPPASPPADATSRGETTRRLEPRAEQLERALIGNDSRLALRGTEHAFPIDVAPGARVETAFGLTDKAWQDARSVTLAVAFTGADGARDTLLERTIDAPAKGANDWTAVDVALDRAAGRRGTLSLDARTPDGKRAGVWASPALVVKPAAGAASRGTNLVLLSIDTLRADHLGAYGYERATSPSIDAMAKRGALFRNATSASSWTLPSHASMLTGLDPSRHGAIQFGFTTPIPPDVRTAAEQLWSAGYDTAAFTDGFFVSPALGFDQGFDRFRGPTQLETAAQDNLERALAWMRTRDGRPFFAFVHTYEVHMPYAPPAPFDTMFTGDYAGPYESKFTYEDYVALEKQGGALDPKLVAHLKALYDGEIRHVDDAVGAFLRGIEDSGLGRDTCVILTSDHGEEFGEHGDLLHARAKLYQELLHVPLIVWCPSRIAVPRVIDDVVGLVDVAPTLLDLAGVAPLDGADGRSLTDALDGKPLPADRALTSEVDGSVEKKTGETAALRAGRHKVIRSSVEELQALFDLDADPGETRDLRAASPATFEKLDGALRERIARPSVASSPAAPGDRPKEATEERLRALGYVLPE